METPAKVYSEFGASEDVTGYDVAAVPVPNPSGSTNKKRCDVFFVPGTALKLAVKLKVPTSPVSSTRQTLLNFLTIPVGNWLVLGTVKLPLLLPHTRKSLLFKLFAPEIVITLFVF